MDEEDEDLQLGFALSLSLTTSSDTNLNNIEENQVEETSVREGNGEEKGIAANLPIPVSCLDSDSTILDAYDEPPQEKRRRSCKKRLRLRSDAEIQHKRRRKVDDEEHSMELAIAMSLSLNQDSRQILNEGERDTTVDDALKTNDEELTASSSHMECSPEESTVTNDFLLACLLQDDESYESCSDSSSSLYGSDVDNDMIGDSYRQSKRRNKKQNSINESFNTNESSSSSDDIEDESLEGTSDTEEKEKEEKKLANHSHRSKREIGVRNKRIKLQNSKNNIGSQINENADNGSRPDRPLAVECDNLWREIHVHNPLPMLRKTTYTQISETAPRLTSKQLEGLKWARQFLFSVLVGFTGDLLVNNNQSPESETAKDLVKGFSADRLARVLRAVNISATNEEVNDMMLLWTTCDDHYRTDKKRLCDICWRSRQELTKLATKPERNGTQQPPTPLASYFCDWEQFCWIFDDCKLKVQKNNGKVW